MKIIKMLPEIYISKFGILSTCKICPVIFGIKLLSNLKTKYLELTT